MHRQRIAPAILVVAFAPPVALLAWGLLLPRAAHARERPGALGSGGARCESCHRDVMVAGHPVNVVPRAAAVPEDWPLDPEGRVTCRTCHLSCGRIAPPSLGTGPVLREGLDGSQICARCHGGGEPAANARSAGARAAGSSAARSHSRLLGVAHPAVGAEADGLDRHSRRCLLCHDGTIAAGREVELDGASRIGHGLSTHPVGNPYPTDFRRHRDNQYVPREGLDPRIALPDSRLGCQSCHNVYAGEEKLLVMPNHGSRLCYACHEI